MSDTQQILVGETLQCITNFKLISKSPIIKNCYDLPDIPLRTIDQDTYIKNLEILCNNFGVKWKTHNKYILYCQKRKNRADPQKKTFFYSYGDFFGSNITLYEIPNERLQRLRRIGYSNGQSIDFKDIYGDLANKKTGIKKIYIYKWAEFLKSHIHLIPSEFHANISRLIFEFLL